MLNGNKSGSSSSYSEDMSPGKLEDGRSMQKSMQKSATKASSWKEGNGCLEKGEVQVQEEGEMGINE